MFGMKKALSMLLAALMLLSALPFGVLAEELAAEGETLTPVYGEAESFVERIEVSPVSLNEGVDGSMTQSYNNETGAYEYWCQYNVYPSFTVYCKNGDSFSVKREMNSYGTYDYEYYYNGRWYYPRVSTDQSLKNVWGIGLHEATLTFADASVTFTVEILPCPYVSIEVLKVDPISETSGYQYGGVTRYYVPNFYYRIYKNDGTWFESSYAVSSKGITVSHDQTNNPWTVGGDNRFTVAVGDFSVTCAVEVIASSPFEYVIQNGGAYITGLKNSGWGESFEIPSAIGSYPVVGLMDASDFDSYDKLILPDSLTVLGEDIVFYNEQLVVGSGVKTLTQDMFGTYWGSCTRSITVSPDNPYMKDIDGVVYNKEGNTLLVYPIGGSAEYTLPAGVKDASVAEKLLVAGESEFLILTYPDGSKNAVEEGGVYYSPDKKTVLFCSSEKNGEYVMPDSVETIMPYAFYNSEITKVTVSKNVTSISYYAFAGCRSLQSVSLPTGVKSIDEYAFRGASELKTINLPAELVEIKAGAFAYCEALESVLLPEGLKKIGDCAFLYTESLKQTLVIPASVETIGSEAFCESGILALDLSKSRAYIDSSAFSYCNGIVSVAISDGITEMGSGVFYNCGSLAEVSIGKGLTTIPASTFSGCESLKGITIPANVTAIGSCAFSYCTSLENVTVLGKLEEIGQEAFAGCALTGELNFATVNKIGVWAFENVGAEKFVVPDGVTDIAYMAFAGSQSLAKFEIPDSVVSICGKSLNNTAWYDDQADGALYLENVFMGYKGTCPETVTVKNGTKIIADYALETKTGVKQVILPEGLEIIGAFAFCETGLESIVIPASVKQIDLGAFFKNPSLKEIRVDENNAYYKDIDGVLYTKDGKELLYCPVRENSFMALSETVSVIHPFAFENSGVSALLIPNDSVRFEAGAIGSYFEAYNATADWLRAAYNKYKYVRILCNKDSTAYQYAQKYSNLLASVPDGIAVDATAVQTQYALGETLNLDGLKVYQCYTENYKLPVENGYTVSGFDSKTGGTKNVTVQYGTDKASFQVEVLPTVSLSQKTVKPEGEVEITVSLAGAPELNRVEISGISYDKEALELVSAAWLGDFSAIEWDLEAGASSVTLASGNADLNGDLAKLRFRVKEGVSEQDFAISVEAELYQTEADSDKAVSIKTKDGKISVKEYTPGDLDGVEGVSSADAIYLLYHTLLGSSRYPVDQPVDYNKDGAIDSADAIYLLYHTLLGASRYPIA